MLALMGRYGRLGNQLWTYSNVLAVSLRYDIRLINPGFNGWPFFIGCAGTSSEDPAYRIKAMAVHVKRPLIQLIYKLNLRARLFPHVQLGESSLLDLDDPSIEACCLRAPFVFLSGFYFFAPESVKAKKSEVLSFFALIPTLQQEVATLVKIARDDSDILIGVHIRHGDYRSYCDGIMYYAAEEYRDVMRALVDQFPGRKVSFLICSDEKQNLAVFRDLKVFQSNSEPVIDMYALASCDYIFGPNSSFSHWASFYGSAPLHILDWRAAEIYDSHTPIYEPQVCKDFTTFQPMQFGTHASNRISIQEAMNWRKVR
jgi:hypothetical protein